MRALNRGLVQAVADPDAGVEALAAAEPALHRPSNRQRLLGTMQLEMGGVEGARLGLGDLDDARLARSVARIAAAKALPRAPAPGELFSRAFLPPLAERVRSLARA